MMIPLAIFGKGQPLSPTGAFVISSIALLFCIYFMIGIFKPSVRSRWGRRGQGGPMSAVGSAAWALFAVTWSFCLLCHGIGYLPVDRNPLPFIGTAMGILFAAALGDMIYYRQFGVRV